MSIRNIHVRWLENFRKQIINQTSAGRAVSGPETPPETCGLSRASEKRQPAIWAQEFELEVLSEGLALLIYRSAHVAESGVLRRHTNRSPLWQLTESGWKMRFHQGTPTQAFEKHAT